MCQLTYIDLALVIRWYIKKERNDFNCNRTHFLLLPGLDLWSQRFLFLKQLYNEVLITLLYNTGTTVTQILALIWKRRSIEEKRLNLKVKDIIGDAENDVPFYI